MVIVLYHGKVIAVKEKNTLDQQAIVSFEANICEKKERKRAGMEQHDYGMKKKTQWGAKNN